MISMNAYNKVEECSFSVLDQSECSVNSIPRGFQMDFDSTSLSFVDLNTGEIVTEQPMKVSARVPSTSSGTSRRQKFDDSAPPLSTPTSVFSLQKSDAHSGNSLQSAKRARVDLNVSETFSESGCNTSRMVLVEIQNKIDNLTKWLDPNVAGRYGGNGFQTENDEVRQMKLTVNELQTEIENLKKEKSSLEEQVETNTPLINALKKGVEATSEFCIKSASLMTTINDQKQSIAQYQNTVETLESELRSSKDETATKEWEIEELNKTIELNIADNTKLEEQLNKMNGKVIEMVPDLERQIEHLQTKVSEATATNGKLEANLYEWKNIAATKEREIEQLHKTIELNTADNSKQEEQLNALNGKFMDMVSELQRRMDDSEKKFIETTAENMKLKEELSQLKNCGARSEYLGLENTKTKCGNRSDNVVNGSNESKNNAEMSKESFSSMPEAWCNEPAVSEKELISENLKQRKFGWIKFSAFKNCNSAPGFVYPPDEDRIPRAQKVTYEGSVAFEKNKFFHYSENIPDSEKLAVHKTAIKRLNKNFGFKFE